MFEKMMADLAAKREADAKRFHGADKALCMICWAYGNDKRSLVLSCFYAVHEAVPEAIDLSGCGEQHKDRGYYLRICKSCRAGLLDHLRRWADERRALRDVPKDHDGHIDYADPAANIPVRIDGAIVMLTPEQWEARQIVPTSTRTKT